MSNCLINNKITKKEFFDNFIKTSHYKFNDQTNLYMSSLTSVWENLHNLNIYGFPKFLNSLNNEFNFNHVIYDMLKKYAYNSINIHNKLNKAYSGYTFHSLTEDEMETIVTDAFTIYCIVQEFLLNLSQEQKNYFEIAQKQYDWSNESSRINKSYISSRKIFNDAYKEYTKIYQTTPPEISFESIC